jgi:hypothetical protein
LRSILAHRTVLGAIRPQVAAVLGGESLVSGTQSLLAALLPSRSQRRPRRNPPQVAAEDGGESLIKVPASEIQKKFLGCLSLLSGPVRFI